MFRRKGLIISIFIAPIISILGIYGISTINDSKVKIGFIDFDKSEQSKFILEKLKDNQKYSIDENIDKDNIESFISNGKIDVIVQIDNDFSEKLIKGEISKIRLSYEQNSEAIVWFENNLNAIVDNLHNIGQASNGNKEVFNKIMEESDKSKFEIKENKLYDEKIGKTISERAVGILMIFMIGTTFSIIEQILKDKYTGMVNRIRMAKSNFFGYFFSFTIIGCIIVIAQTIIIQLALMVLGINSGIPIQYYMLSIFSFGLICVGISICLGALCKENSTAQIVANIFNIPFAMLAGAFWPVYLMPDFMQKIAKFIPQNWTMSSIVAIQNSNDINLYFAYIIKLVITSVILFLISGIVMIKKFNK